MGRAHNRHEKAHLLVGAAESVASLQLRLWAWSVDSIEGFDAGNRCVNLKRALGDWSTPLACKFAHFHAMNMFFFFTFTTTWNVCRYYTNLYRPSKCSLWHGLKVKGDGIREGWVISGKSNAFESSFSDLTRHHGEVEGTVEELEAGPLHRTKSQKADSRRLTRLQTVQQLFHSLINRTEAYDHPHRIALVLFGSEVGQER